jgi:putative flippase GtrA
MSGVAGRIAELRDGRSDLFRRVFRYGAGSIVAVVCSQATFLVLYGPVHASTTVSSTLAWLAGAVPNYWLNRSWTWGRRGRPSLGRELVPYAAIILGTLGLAIVATAAAAAALEGTSLSDAARTLIVARHLLRRVRRDVRLQVPAVRPPVRTGGSTDGSTDVGTEVGAGRRRPGKPLTHAFGHGNPVPRRPTGYGRTDPDGHS